MLYIVASYHRMQFPEKLMIETQENDKKPQFGPDLDPLSPNSDRQLFFFFKNLLCSIIKYHGQLSSNFEKI